MISVYDVCLESPAAGGSLAGTIRQDGNRARFVGQYAGRLGSRLHRSNWLGMELIAHCRLFPFYVLGHYFKRRGWIIYQVFPNRGMALVVMLASALMMWTWPNLFQFDLLSGANSYFKMGLDETGLILRLVLYMIQCLMIMAFFTLLPRKPFVISHLGTKTLTIYILHGFIVKGRVAGPYFDELTIGRVLFLPMLAAVLVMVLGRLPIRFQLSPYVLKQNNREKKNKEKVSQSKKALPKPNVRFI